MLSPPQGQAASSMTCIQIHNKAERIGALLVDKAHLNTGDHVALIYPPGLDLIAAFYGCLYVGTWLISSNSNSLMASFNKTY